MFYHSENPQEVYELLKKLKHSGLLTSEKKRREEAERAERERMAAEARRNKPPSPPPIACDNRILNNVERRQTPASALDQFSMRSLIM